MGNLPRGTDREPLSGFLSNDRSQGACLGSPPQSSYWPQDSGPQDSRVMHAVGTCSTGILAILFPTTDRILTRTLPGTPEL